MDDDEVYFHAPTVTAFLLRQAAEVIETASRQLPGEEIYFPPKTSAERQPVFPEGRLSLEDIAGLVRYLADMLEA